MKDTDRDTPADRLRVAPLGSLPEQGLVLDLGRGAAVTITREGWRVTTSGVTLPHFEAAAAAFLPIPVSGGSLTGVPSSGKSMALGSV
ncbi:hypothetical protein AB0F18_33580 [Streptomyces sp. NPDC029216]|uniref:hypothetical protein n=1 Tax=Streptomyces sp. NPDC029216 TaxID=3154701 RepID=UPI00340C42B6